MTFPLNSNNKQSYISVTYNTIHILTVKTQLFLHKNTQDFRVIIALIHNKTEIFDYPYNSVEIDCHLHKQKYTII